MLPHPQRDCRKIGSKELGDQVLRGVEVGEVGEGICIAQVQPVTQRGEGARIRTGKLWRDDGAGGLRPINTLRHHLRDETGWGATEWGGVAAWVCGDMLRCGLCSVVQWDEAR